MMITMTALCLVLVVFLIAGSELSWPRLALAVIAALIASYSFGAGIVAWPVGLLLLLLCPGIGMRQRCLLSLAWCLCAVATMLGYFFQYQSTPANESAIAAVTRPIAFLFYLLAYIGSPLFSYSARLAVLAGLAGAVAAVFLLLKSRRDGFEPGLPFVGLMTIACGVAVLSGLKQSHEGIAQALSPRYIIWPAFFWIGLLGLTYLRSLSTPEADEAKSGHATIAAVAAIAFFALLSSVYGTYRADERHDAFLLGRKALLEGREDEDLRYLYPEPEVAASMRPTLVRYELSVFR